MLSMFTFPMPHFLLLNSTLLVVHLNSPFPELHRKYSNNKFFNLLILIFIYLFSSSNVTHTVVIRPQEGVRGRFNFTAGEVTYLSEGLTDLQIGFTSEPGEGFIVSLKEFNKRFSPHYVRV